MYDATMTKLACGTRFSYRARFVSFTTRIVLEYSPRVHSVFNSRARRSPVSLAAEFLSTWLSASVSLLTSRADQLQQGTNQNKISSKSYLYIFTAVSIRYLSLNCVNNCLNESFF